MPAGSSTNVVETTTGTDPRRQRILEMADRLGVKFMRLQFTDIFGVIKNVFGFRKVRYRGLAKNLHRLEVTAALTNLYMVRRRLLNA